MTDSDDQAVDHAADAAAMRAYLQGALFQAARHDLPTLEGLRKPVTVAQPKDENGNYLPFFTIELASGMVFLAGVEYVDMRSALS